MIIYAYTFTLIFTKAKTASNWFTIINFLFLGLMIPVTFPKNLTKGTFFGYIRWLKYFCPFFDITY